MATKPSRATKVTSPASVILGENVYRFRVLRAPKMSQRALANLSGVAMETVRLLEKNREPKRKVQLSPHLDTIDKIAAALGVSVSRLFEETSTPSKPTGQRHLFAVPAMGDALPAPS